MNASRLLAAALAAALVTGCGVKPLKAPCARDEGPPIVPMAYSSLGTAGPTVTDECGPMKPVNDRVAKGREGSPKGRVAP